LLQNGNCFWIFFKPCSLWLLFSHTVVILLGKICKHSFSPLSLFSPFHGKVENKEERREDRNIMDEKRREKQQRREEKVGSPTLMGEYKGIMLGGLLVPGAESL